MSLYLVQHGAAKSEAEDPDRPLTDEGRRTVEHMANWAAALKIEVERIEHSDKLRARQTAELFAQTLHPHGGCQQVSGLAPLDDVESVLHRLETETRALLLVGHLPHLSRLASRLLGLPADQAAVQFSPGGIVRLDRDPRGGWAVRWVLPPDTHPSPQ